MNSNLRQLYEENCADIEQFIKSMENSILLKIHRDLISDLEDTFPEIIISESNLSFTGPAINNLAVMKRPRFRTENRGKNIYRDDNNLTIELFLRSPQNSISMNLLEIEIEDLEKDNPDIKVIRGCPYRGIYKCQIFRRQQYKGNA